MQGHNAAVRVAMDTGLAAWRGAWTAWRLRNGECVGCGIAVWLGQAQVRLTQKVSGVAGCRGRDGKQVNPRHALYRGGTVDPVKHPATNCFDWSAGQIWFVINE